MRGCEEEMHVRIEYACKHDRVIQCRLHDMPWLHKLMKNTYCVIGGSM